MYKGTWFKGIMQGIGELTMSQGEVYVGEFIAGYPYGQGVRKWINGDVYKGQFKNGFQSGQGSFTCKEGGWSYSGEWQ